MTAAETPEMPTPDGSVKQEYLLYGGQAVIEGVMMRSPGHFAVACRAPSGEIVLRGEPIDATWLAKLKWLRRPLLRGTLALIDAMALGARALKFASRVQLGQETGSEPEGSPSVISAAPNSGKSAEGNRLSDVAIGGTLLFSFLAGAGLFVALPTLLTGVAHRAGLFGAHGAVSRYELNVSDGIIRMLTFFAYILLISLLPGIREVFMYHGAEHKAINTLEAGKELTLQNAEAASRIHPRCGTSFIFVVLLINLVLYVVLPRPVWYLRIPLHLAIVPLVAGLAYETIKLAGRFRSSFVVMTLLAPGMWSQYLTTRVPRPDQIEVALMALRAVMKAEAAVPGPTSVEPALAVQASSL
ncbi:MAG: DUF1385 domain-containing protein [Armatimonadetes bacterium]|nr:DUF1385 domain-containing protein [Armatimonadota bacterium]MDE2207853.1 DUF1385 domain-containing protein [Armatimonadota bacterium]